MRFNGAIVAALGLLLITGCASTRSQTTAVKLPSGALFDELSGVTFIELRGTDPNAGSKRAAAFFVNVLAGTSINARNYEHLGNLRVECSEDGILSLGLYTQANAWGAQGDAGQVKSNMTNPMDVERRVSMDATIDGKRNKFTWVGKGLVADGLVRSENPQEDIQKLSQGTKMRLRFQKETAKKGPKDVVFDLAKYHVPVNDVVERCEQRSE